MRCKSAPVLQEERQETTRERATRKRRERQEELRYTASDEKRWKKNRERVLRERQKHCHEGLFNSCFGRGDSPRPISVETLQNRAKKHMREMGICYETSIRLALCEKTLSKHQAAYLLETINSGRAIEKTSYTKAYQKAMRLDRDSPISLSLDKFLDPGFLNFQEKGSGRFVHTAYVQVASDGEAYIYNTNFLPLDFLLFEGGEKNPKRTGNANRYQLNSSRLDLMQTWLINEDIQVYYTKVVDLAL